MKEEYKVLAIKKDDLEDSIAAFTKLKPILQRQVRQANGNDKKQAETDVRELGNHFDTAINSMITVLAFMEGQEDNMNVQ